MKQPEKFKAYCPLMQDVCVNGHTKKMGKDDDGEPIRCVNLMTVMGKEPDESGDRGMRNSCAMAYHAIITAEVSQMVRQQTHSVDRNGVMMFESFPADVQKRIAGKNILQINLTPGGQNEKP